jgi:chemotaxis protein MotB
MRRYQGSRKEQTRHADDWLMTYADTITLLLCLFVVILSITVARDKVVRKLGDLPTTEQSTVPENSIEAALPFHDFVRTDHPVNDAADDAQAGAGDNPAVPLPETPPLAARVIAAASASLVVDLPVMQVKATDDAHLPQLPEIVDRLKSQGQAATEQEGERVTTLEIGSAAFFGSGSATLSDSGRAILRDVAVNLQSDALKDYQITVEGYTDDTPIRTSQFPSNWELSAARAAAVVRCFQEQGIAPQRLRAAGYADTFPVVANRNPDGSPNPENQARNRRVVIKLEKIDNQNRDAPLVSADRLARR